MIRCNKEGIPYHQPSSPPSTCGNCLFTAQYTQLVVQSWTFHQPWKTWNVRPTQLRREEETATVAAMVLPEVGEATTLTDLLPITDGGGVLRILIILHVAINVQGIIISIIIRHRTVAVEEEVEEDRLGIPTMPTIRWRICDAWATALRNLPWLHHLRKSWGQQNVPFTLPCWRFELMDCPTKIFGGLGRPRMVPAATPM